MQFNVHQAKTQLSKLIERAENGEEVIIARDGKPAVRLTPVPAAPKKRKLGTLKGKIWMADDFDEWTPELEQMFYGPDPEDPLFSSEPPRKRKTASVRTLSTVAKKRRKK